MYYLLLFVFIIIIYIYYVMCVYIQAKLYTQIYIPHTLALSKGIVVVYDKNYVN